MLKFAFNFNKDTWEYLATITDVKRQKSYIGKCRLHKEDLDNKSSYFGYEIAESRAYKKYYKDLIYELKLKQKSLLDFYNHYKDNKNFDAKNFLERKIKKQIHLYEKEIVSLKLTLIALNEGIRLKIELKDKSSKKINETT